MTHPLILRDMRIDRGANHMQSLERRLDSVREELHSHMAEAD